MKDVDPEKDGVKGIREKEIGNETQHQKLTLLTGERSRKSLFTFPLRYIRDRSR
jgi:hypothetical protein